MIEGGEEDDIVEARQIDQSARSRFAPKGWIVVSIRSVQSNLTRVAERN